MGGSLINIREVDDYYTRIVAGCSAGAVIGINSKRANIIDISLKTIIDRSLPTACVACVSLGTIAAISKFLDENNVMDKSKVLAEMSRPMSKAAESTWKNNSEDQ